MELEENELYIVDKSEDIKDTIYHMQVRFYNLVLIQEEKLNYCLDILSQKQSTATAVIVITSNRTKDYELKCLKKGALCVIKESFCKELILAKIESIHRENFRQRLQYKDYFIIDREDKEVLSTNGEELAIRGKAYDILDYLVKNKNRPPISKEELINALWEDPELVCQNVIEVNVNSIRVRLKKSLNIDLIDTIRNRGYKLK